MATMTLIPTGPTAVPGDVPIVSSSPPIVHVFRITVNVLSAGFSAISIASGYIWSVLKTLLGPFGHLLSGITTPLFYILAPVIVVVGILIEVLITGPYSLTVGLLRAIYPIYVFVGAACIVAAAIGLCARGAVHFFHASIFEVDPTSDAATLPATTVKDSHSKTAKKTPIKTEADVRTVPLH